MTDKSPGQLAYEDHLRQFPNYHNGWPRPPWDRLSWEAQQDWEMATLAVMQEVRG
jgi:hypothetical protein